MGFRHLYDCLSHLRPYDILGSRKLRVGAAHDGGYVMLDRLRPSQIVFSYGLSWNIAYELDLAQRGMTLFMFDHTIDGLTVEHANFTWFKEGLGASTDVEARLHRLEDHVARLAPGEQGMILKLDVEGAEWAALAKMPIDLLGRFEQIVMELHDFRLISDPAWRDVASAALANLGQQFTLHNVHANNHAPVVIVDGVPVADVIEVSYIRTDLVERRQSSTLFPSYLDSPNDPNRPEIPLWFFPFMPFGPLGDEGAISDAIGGAATRMDLLRQQSEMANGARLSDGQTERSAEAAASAFERSGKAGMGLNILCISVHPVLEYDEIRLFESLGHRVFSLGFYFHRTNENNLRPALEQTEWHDDCVTAFSATACHTTDAPVQWQVTREFCRRFDVIIVHHNHAFIRANWNSLSGSCVVWRTIGQEVHWAEDSMREFRARGVKIVRWSPEERDIDRYIGADAVIRAAKDPGDWFGWTGQTRRIVTFNNNFRQRGEGLSFDFHQQCVDGLPFDLYGIGNADVPEWRGVTAYAEQQRLLRSHCAAFVTGTSPAPYTLGFIEAWMTGIPVVHVGRQQSSRGAKGVFEIDRLITHGQNGFLVEDVVEARAILRQLIRDVGLCEAISVQGRASAIEYFGIDRATLEWSEFFRDHVTC